jgi:hypothetical protein
MEQSDGYRSCLNKGIKDNLVPGFCKNILGGQWGVIFILDFVLPLKLFEHFFNETVGVPFLPLFKPFSAVNALLAMIFTHW